MILDNDFINDFINEYEFKNKRIDVNSICKKLNIEIAHCPLPYNIKNILLKDINKPCLIIINSNVCNNNELTEQKAIGLYLINEQKKKFTYIDYDTDRPEIMEFVERITQYNQRFRLTIWQRIVATIKQIVFESGDVKIRKCVNGYKVVDTDGLITTHDSIETAYKKLRHIFDEPDLLSDLTRKVIRR